MCSKRDVHKSPSLPLFQRGRPVHRRKPTGSEGASCRGLLYFVLALALRAGLRGPRFGRAILLALINIQAPSKQ